MIARIRFVTSQLRGSLLSSDRVLGLTTIFSATLRHGMYAFVPYLFCSKPYDSSLGDDRFCSSSSRQWLSPSLLWWQSSSLWAWPQLLSVMSSLRQVEPSCQQMLEAIRQASYCPSGCDSSSSLFPNVAQYPYFPISCDLDINRLWRALPLREFWCFLFR